MSQNEPLFTGALWVQLGNTKLPFVHFTQVTGDRAWQLIREAVDRHEKQWKELCELIGKQPASGEGE